MLPSHQRVATYGAYEIWQRQPGFEFTPMMLGKVASFIAQVPDGKFSVFAFMYSMLAILEGVEIQEEHLLNEAVYEIEKVIDRDSAGQQIDFTFEYRDDTWVEVDEPRWWIRAY